MTDAFTLPHAGADGPRAAPAVELQPQGLDFAPRSGGAYDMAVSGMGPKQQKDAVAVATSSLGYFACPEGQKGRLQNEPAYADAKWRMQAKCG